MAFKKAESSSICNLGENTFATLAIRFSSIAIYEGLQWIKVSCNFLCELTLYINHRRRQVDRALDLGGVSHGHVFPISPKLSFVSNFWKSCRLLLITSIVIIHNFIFEWYWYWNMNIQDIIHNNSYDTKVLMWDPSSCQPNAMCSQTDKYHKIFN